MTPAKAVSKALGALEPRPACLGVAVSGGSDSLALLYLVADWTRQSGVELQVATVDHRLRPEAADEARMVAEHCRTLGASHDTLIWEHEDAAGNLQDMARRARYRLLADWADERGVGLILLGHTLDDQAETFLMRLARGSGVDGLSGMAESRVDDGITWLRPLLGCTREALRDELRSRGLTWSDDPSNEDEKYSRVRVRKLLSALAPLGLDAEKLADTAARMASAREALEIETRRQAEMIAKVDMGDLF